MKIPEDEDFEAMRRIAETCGEIAKSRGWHEEEVRAHRTLHYLEEFLLTFPEEARGQEPYMEVAAHVDRVRAEIKRTNGVPVLGLLALVASEIGEAVEVVRDPKIDPLKRYVNTSSGSRDLSDEECAAVLAGLRMLQMSVEGKRLDDAFEAVADIYTDDGRFEGLNSDAIDALCDKINLSAD